MPPVLLDEAAAGSIRSAFARRRWYPLPVSAAAHGVLLAAFVVAPLVAPSRLPSIPESARQAFVVSIATPPELPPPPRRTTPPVAVARALAARAAPVEAPEGVTAETGVEIGAGALRELTAGSMGVVVGTEGGLPAASAMPAPLPPEEPLRLGGEISAPVRVVDVAPVYPAIAQAARVEGVVIIEATISATGAVVDARVLRSVPLLDEAALTAVRQWRYTPTRLNGVPVPVIMTVTVHFALRDAR